MRSLGIASSRPKSGNTPAGTLAVLLSVGIVINGFGLILLAIAFLGVAGKAPPAMVQLETGRAIAMEPLDTQQRTPAVIQSFVRDTLTLLFSASGKLPPQPGKQPLNDTGVPVKTPQGDAKISTVASLASLGLTDEDNFRASFLQKLAEYTPQEVFSGNGSEMALAIRYVSEPIVGKTRGTWEITLMAEQIVRSPQQPTGVAVPFNRVITVQAITPPVVKDYSTDLERQISTVRQTGLVITKIEPYRASAQ